MSNSEFFAKFCDALVEGEKLNREAKARYEEEQCKIEEEKKARLQSAQMGAIDKYTPIILEKLLYTASQGHCSTLIRFDRSDFRGWHKFVEGGYGDAHPVDLGLSMIGHMREYDHIPKCLDFELSDEQKFIIKFSWGCVKEITESSL